MKVLALLKFLGGAIGSFLSGIGGKILIYITAKRAGRQEAVNEALEGANESAKTRAHISDDIAGKSDSDLDAELRRDQRGGEG